MIKKNMKLPLVTFQLSLKTSYKFFDLLESQDHIFDSFFKLVRNYKELSILIIETH
jgi:hypothetical protein